MNVTLESVVGRDLLKGRRKEDDFGARSTHPRKGRRTSRQNGATPSSVKSTNNEKGNEIEEMINPWSIDVEVKGKVDDDRIEVNIKRLSAGVRGEEGSSDVTLQGGKHGVRKSEQHGEDEKVELT